MKSTDWLVAIWMQYTWGQGPCLRAFFETHCTACFTTKFKVVSCLAAVRPSALATLTPLRLAHNGVTATGTSTCLQVDMYIIPQNPSRVILAGKSDGYYHEAICSAISQQEQTSPSQSKAIVGYQISLRKHFMSIERCHILGANIHYRFLTPVVLIDISLMICRKSRLGLKYQQNTSAMLKVGNLATHVTEEAVHEVFGAYGEFESGLIITEPTGDRRQVFLTFRRSADAGCALKELNNAVMPSLTDDSFMKISMVSHAGSQVKEVSHRCCTKLIKHTARSAFKLMECLGRLGQQNDFHEHEPCCLL